MILAFFFPFLMMKMMMIEMEVSYFFPQKGTQQKDFSASNLKDANDASFSI